MLCAQVERSEDRDKDTTASPLSLHDLITFSPLLSLLLLSSSSRLSFLVVLITLNVENCWNRFIGWYFRKRERIREEETKERDNLGAEQGQRESEEGKKTETENRRVKIEL